MYVSCIHNHRLITEKSQAKREDFLAISLDSPWGGISNFASGGINGLTATASNIFESDDGERWRCVHGQITRF